MLFRQSTRRVQAPRPAPGDLVQVQGAEVRLAVNARARGVSLRLDVSRRQVVAMAPSVRALPDAVAFAHSRADWVLARLAALPDVIVLRPGAVIEVAGEPCRLERAAMRIRPSFKAATDGEPARLIASGEGSAFSRAVLRGLQAEALARLAERTAHHCAMLQQPTPRLALQDARSRWGSCQAAGPRGPALIRYSWRLVLTPSSVLDYVAAHECAHLLEANHGPRFWALVRRLYGDPAQARAWLKANQARLQAVGLLQD